jgi:hypothetical protein
MVGTGIMATVKSVTSCAHSVSIAAALVNTEFATYSVLCAGSGKPGQVFPVGMPMMQLKAKLVGNRTPPRFNLPAALIPLKSLSFAITLGKVVGWMTTISSD